MADIKNIYATNADAYFDLQDQYALQLKKDAIPILKIMI